MNNIANLPMSESPITDPDAPAADREEINLLDLLIVIARHKKLVLGLPFVAAIIAAVIALQLPNIYTAETRILPPQQSQSSTAAALLGSLGGLAGGQLGIKNPIELYVGMLKSRTVADQLIVRFNLKELYKTETFIAARMRLQGATKVTAGKDGFITLEFDDPDPKRAAVMANAYVEELDRLTQSLAVTEASRRRLFFEQQLKAARDNLAKAELALRKTQESTGLFKLDDQGKAIIESVARMRAEIAAKEVQLSAMRTFATDKNPEYLMAQQQLSGLKAQLAKLETNNVSGRGDIFVPTGRVPEAGLEYMRRFRDVKYHETMFEILAKQYELARIDEAKDPALIQVVDKAVEPEWKSKPSRSQIVILAAIVVGFLTIVWLFMKEASQKVRRNPQQAERLGVLRRTLLGK